MQNVSLICFCILTENLFLKKTQLYLDGKRGRLMEEMEKLRERIRELENQVCTKNLRIFY